MKNRVLSIIICLALSFVLIPSMMFYSSAESNVTYQLGDIVEYGSYPQGLVTEYNSPRVLQYLRSVEDDVLWTSYEYNYGTYDSTINFTNGHNHLETYSSDYMKYTDVVFEGKMYRGVMVSKIRPQQIYYPARETETKIYWYKYEPLRWRVLSPDEGLLLSEYIVDCQAFDTTYFVKYYTKTEPNVYGGGYTTYYYSDLYNNSNKTELFTWDNSTLKTWLNSSFKEWAFSEEESQNVIKVDLLSKEESLNNLYGFDHSDEDTDLELPIETDYALRQGASSFWLLKPTVETNKLQAVNTKYFQMDEKSAARLSGIRMTVTVSDIGICKPYNNSLEYGVSISNIEKTSSSENIDTYTITLTDGSTYTFTVTNGVNGLNGTNGQDGQDGQDGVGIASAVIDENGKLVITLTDGTPMDLGVVKGADGQNGTNGADGRGITNIVFLSSVDNVDTYQISYTDGTKSTFTVTNGLNGQNGSDGQDGAPGVGIRAAAINADGELVITLTDGTPLILGVVKGSDGQNGADGENGITPQLKIGDDNYWYVSYNNGETWTSLDVKATGENGVDGQNGQDGADGITPQLRINEETNYWEVSYDDGATWTSLDIKACGENGADGVGVQSAELNKNGELIITLTNGNTFNLGVIKGADGKDGVDGKDGTDGKDGATITSMYYNSKGELVIKMSDGTEVNAGKPSGSAYDTNMDKPTVTISGYQASRSIDYGTTITFHSKASYIPEGYQLRWFVNGEDKGASQSLTISNASSDFTVCARLMKNGSSISESKVEKVTVKSDFFSVIIAFFKKLFNSNAFVIDQR